MEKTRVIKAKSLDESTQQAEEKTSGPTKRSLREVVTPQQAQSAKSIYEKISQDSLFMRNFYYPGGREAFPNAPQLQYVERYYPNATGGPIAFDTVGYLDDQEMCELKRKHLAKAKIKYAIVKPEMTDQEVMEQLA